MEHVGERPVKEKHTLLYSRSSSSSGDFIKESSKIIRRLSPPWVLNDGVLNYYINIKINNVWQSL